MKTSKLYLLLSLLACYSNSYAQSNWDELNKAGVDYFKAGNFEQAIQTFEKAKKFAEKKLGKKSSEYVGTLSNLGIAYKQIKQYNKAEVMFAESAEIIGKILGEEHLRYAAALLQLADLYFLIDKYEKAEPLYLWGIQIRSKALGKAHPEYAVAVKNAADMYFVQNKYSKAAPLYEEARVIYARFPDKVLALAEVLYFLANTYYGMSNFPKVLNLTLESADIRKKELGANHPDYIAALKLSAAVYYLLGDYEKAEKIFLDVMSTLEQSSSKDSRNYSSTLYVLANLYKTIGNYKKAEQYGLELLGISLMKNEKGYIYALAQNVLGSAASSRTRARQVWNRAGVILPFTDGTTSRCAPNARIVCSFSSAKASDDTKCAR